MKVLHIIDGISRSNGGPSRSSQGLVVGLRKVGIDAWLMTLVRGEEPWVKGCDTFINGGLFEEALVKVKPDIVHLHGIWDTRLHRCAVICRRWKIPYVIAPRGMLESWSLKQKWLKKRVARWLYQDRDLRGAAALHATAESEAEQFRKLGFGNPVIVSPNGVNVPEGKGEFAIRDCKGEGPSDKKRRALFVSRMHPKKGVIELVESWARVRQSGIGNPLAHWQCELVYTLNDETERAYEAKVKQRINELGMTYVDGKDGRGEVRVKSSSPRTEACDFILTGPLNDDEKWEAYRRADLFVLPTFSENFGIVVAEALWAGVPVITTKGTPWSEIVSRRCGWWIDLPLEESSSRESKSKSGSWPSLDASLREAASTPDLDLLGQRGHALIQEKYTWTAVVKAMIHGYEQIVNTCKMAP